MWWLSGFTSASWVVSRPELLFVSWQAGVLISEADRFIQRVFKISRPTLLIYSIAGLFLCTTWVCLVWFRWDAFSLFCTAHSHNHWTTDSWWFICFVFIYVNKYDYLSCASTTLIFFMPSRDSYFILFFFSINWLPVKENGKKKCPSQFPRAQDDSEARDIQSSCQCKWHETQKNIQTSHLRSWKQKYMLILRNYLNSNLTNTIAWLMYSQYVQFDTGFGFWRNFAESWDAKIDATLTYVCLQARC